MRKLIFILVLSFWAIFPVSGETPFTGDVSVTKSISTTPAEGNGPTLPPVFDDDGSISVGPSAPSKEPEPTPITPKTDPKTTSVTPPKKDEPSKTTSATAPATTKKKTTKVYVVVKGDTLWGIAEKLLGDGSKFMDIVKANKEKLPSLLKNPNLILPGWKIEIVVEEEVATTPQKPPGSTGAQIPSPGKPNGTELTTAQKTEKLQKAFSALCRSSAALGKKYDQLNTETVRLMISKGFMTEAEWMECNPPEDSYWKIENGKVILAKKTGVPASGNPSADADKKAKQAEIEAQAAAKAAAEKAAAAKAAAEKAQKEKTAAAKAAAEKAAAEKVAAEKAAAEKAAAEKAAKEKAAKEKADKEKAAQAAKDAEGTAQKYYEKDLSAMGMPNIWIRNDGPYYKAVLAAKRLLPDTFFKASPLSKFIDFQNLHGLQWTLLEAHKSYEKNVRENDTTNRIWNPFDDDIESAKKKVDQAKESLAKAWNEFKPLLNQMNSMAKDSKAQIDRAKKEQQDLQAKLNKIDRYDPKNGNEVSSILKSIKERDDLIKEKQKDIDSFQPLKQMFKL